MDTGAKNFRLERERNEQIQKMKEKQEEIYRQKMAYIKKMKEEAKKQLEVVEEVVETEEDN